MIGNIANTTHEYKRHKTAIRIYGIHLYLYCTCILCSQKFGANFSELHLPYGFWDAITLYQCLCITNTALFYPMVDYSHLFVYMQNCV